MAAVSPTSNPSAQRNHEDFVVSGCCPISLCRRKSTVTKVDKARQKPVAEPAETKAEAAIPSSKATLPNRTNITDPPVADLPPKPTIADTEARSQADHKGTIASPENGTVSTPEADPISPANADTPSLGSQSRDIAHPPESNQFTTPRLEAERRYKAAAQKLQQIVKEAIPDSSPAIPDAVDSPDKEINLALGAAQIETAMARFIEQRRAQEESQTQATKFVKKWFQASFPIINAGFKFASVRMIFQFVC